MANAHQCDCLSIQRRSYRHLGTRRPDINCNHPRFRSFPHLRNIRCRQTQRQWQSTRWCYRLAKPWRNCPYRRHPYWIDYLGSTLQPTMVRHVVKRLQDAFKCSTVELVSDIAQLGGSFISCRSNRRLYHLNHHPTSSSYYTALNMDILLSFGLFYILF